MRLFGVKPSQTPYFSKNTMEIVPTCRNHLKSSAFSVFRPACSIRTFALLTSSTMNAVIFSFSFSTASLPTRSTPCSLTNRAIGLFGKTMCGITNYKLDVIIYICFSKRSQLGENCMGRRQDGEFSRGCLPTKRLSLHMFLIFDAPEDMENMLPNPFS